MHGLKQIHPSKEYDTPCMPVNEEFVHDLWLAIRDFEEKGTPYLTDELQEEYDKLKEDCRYGLPIQWKFEGGIKLGNEILELEKKNGGDHSLVRKRNELSDIITKRLIQESEWDLRDKVGHYAKKFVIKTLKDIFNIDGAGLDQTIPGTLVSADRIKAILQFQDESIRSYRGKPRLSEPVAMIGLRFGRNLENSPCSFKSKKKAKVKSKYKSYEALKYLQEEIDSGRSHSKEGLISCLTSKIFELEARCVRENNEINEWTVRCKNPLISEGRKYVYEQQRVVDGRRFLAQDKDSLEKLKEDLRIAS